MKKHIGKYQTVSNCQRINNTPDSYNFLEQNRYKMKSLIFVATVILFIAIVQVIFFCANYIYSIEAVNSDFQIFYYKLRR